MRLDDLRPLILPTMVVGADGNTRNNGVTNGESSCICIRAREARALHGHQTVGSTERCIMAFSREWLVEHAECVPLEAFRIFCPCIEFP